MLELLRVFIYFIIFSDSKEKVVFFFKVDDEIVREALESGMDLREYSSKLEEQLKSAHRLAVHDCIEQADKLADLHIELTACDDAFAVCNLCSFFFRDL